MKLRIISAGAAQSVVQQVLAAMQAQCELESEVSFGAVGAQKQKLLAGAPADVIILTASMIDELSAAGMIQAGSRQDLGAVCGGIAVRAGSAPPKVSSAEELSAALQAASAIYIPDPAIATAGMQFLQMCERLGIGAKVKPKLRTFPNGFAAMTQLAQGSAADEIGCTQITEILFVPGVDLVAPLPRSLQSPTTYSLGIAATTADSAVAQAFAKRLAGPGAAAMLAAAGFGMS